MGSKQERLSAVLRRRSRQYDALEHINRSMKVSGGLVGITPNQGARTKFFLITPELARLAEQAKNMAGVSSKTQGHHHNLATTVLAREEKGIEQLTATIEPEVHKSIL